MVSARLPVPPGFVLLRDGYRDSMRAAGVDAQLAALHRDALAAASEPDRLDDLSRRLRDIVSGAGVADDVRAEIPPPTTGWGRRSGGGAVLGHRRGRPDASFAGMNRTLTNVRGDDELIQAVLECWMSLFGSRVIAYRQPASPPTPRWPWWCSGWSPGALGVGFTADPSTGARDRVVIEAALGLGEVVVSGLVTPDTMAWWTRNRCASSTSASATRTSGSPRPRRARPAGDLEPELADARVLDDDTLRRVAELARDVERHYGCPQDLEWAVAGDAIWLVQARPVTTPRGGGARRRDPDSGAGLSAAPGVASGAVRILRNPGRPRPRRRRCSSRR